MVYIPLETDPTVTVGRLDEFRMYRRFVEAQGSTNLAEVITVAGVISLSVTILKSRRDRAIVEELMAYYGEAARLETAEAAIAFAQKMVDHVGAVSGPAASAA